MKMVGTSGDENNTAGFLDYGGAKGVRSISGRRAIDLPCGADDRG